MKLIIVDAYSLLYKAFYGVRAMHAPNGTPTNAIYGFMNMMLKLIREQTPDYFCVAFDFGKLTFRNSLYSEYKAGREAMPEDLRAQVPIVRELLGAANVACFACEGYEADDIIGAVSRQCENNGIFSLIVTGDRDSFQLVSETVSVLYAKRGVSDTVTATPEYIMQTYGVTPIQLIDVKSLMGDSSDNIPGISGIGEKTALSLIAKYSDLAGVYEHIGETKGKLRERLEGGRESSEMSRELAEIRRELPCDFDLDGARRFDFSAPAVCEQLRSLSMNNILKQLGELEKAAPPPEETKKSAPPSQRLQQKGLDYTEYVGKTVACVFELRDDGESLVAICGDAGIAVHTSVSDSQLAAFCDNGEIKKLVHELKPLYKALKNRNITPRGFVFDVSVAAYVINSSEEKYQLSDLSERYLQKKLSENVTKQQQSFFDLLDDSLLSQNMSERAQCIMELYPLLRTKLSEEQCEALYFDIEHELITVLAEMELCGFAVDRSVLNELDSDYDSQMDALRTEIQALSGRGESFNVNSPKQLGEVLFEDFRLPVVKKTKTGYSTDIEVLETLSGAHPIIPKIIRLRQISKLSGTYIKGMIKLIDPRDERIHTTFNQTITTTGRLSSSNPNLQNIPVKTEEGKIIRKVFKSSASDRVLVDADYSQIELRVLAHISNDENMISAFVNGEDIHRRTAGEVFGVPPEEVSSEQRSRAKAVNFGIVYGISDFGLSKNLGISRRDAKNYIDTYLEKFPAVKKYMADVIESAKELGYVSTMFHRRRYLPDIKSQNRNIRAFGERTAMNTPIQGSAADIIKIAMVKIYKRLAQMDTDAKLILQVHDELIVDCRAEQAEQITAMMREEMENCAKLSAPLRVDIASGANWFDAK